MPAKQFAAVVIAPNNSDVEAVEMAIDHWWSLVANMPHVRVNEDVDVTTDIGTVTWDVNRTSTFLPFVAEGGIRAVRAMGTVHVDEKVSV